jgi:sugar (pentulose or hexulose) kinase
MSSVLLAAGTRQSEVAILSGMGQFLAAPVAKPEPAPGRIACPLAVGDGYLHIAHHPVGGEALDWLYRLCFADQSPTEFFDSTLPAAAQRGTRVALDPFDLSGDSLEIEARRASFRDLTLAAERFDLAAAIVNAMRRGHREARANLNVAGTRIVLTGSHAETIRRLVVESDTPCEALDDAALRGAARLFQG